jgi:uncharacterized iron-regulated membrane protein
MTVLGYLMWWRRRPTLGIQPTLFDAWRQMGLGARGAVLLVAAGLGMALPVLGVSLLGFIAWDLLQSFNGARRNSLVGSNT